MSDYTGTFDDDTDDDYGTPFEDARRRAEEAERQRAEAEMRAEEADAEMMRRAAEREARNRREFDAEMDAIPEYVNGPDGYLVQNPDYLHQLDAAMKRRGSAGLYRSPA